MKNNDFINTIPSKDRILIEELKARRLTYLSRQRLSSIAEAIREVEENCIPGEILEAGCALGGSSILIAKLKNSARKFIVYDTFEMIPSPSENDTKEVHDRYRMIIDGKSEGIGSDLYYGYEDNLIEKIIGNFHLFSVGLTEQNVYLMKGLLQETMHIDSRVAFAHIDVDWYDPVKTCLERVSPNLSIGGVIIVDDYFDWGGCRKAVDEFLDQHGECYEVNTSSGALKCTKKC